MDTESVVSIEEISANIVQITMQDRESGNGFSDSIVAGLTSAFERIRHTPDYRVAVLTGYDSYFCSGGTRASLLALYEGEARFSDGNLYSLPLDCDIPVIAAMQGHGIGGGFVFGIFSDFVVLSRESIYAANFMKYGFTPGFGATFILREKLGLALAQEMLMTAEHFRGGDLEKRGIPFPVMSRKDVLSYSLGLAEQLAEKPRRSLVALKRHLVSDCRERLPFFIEKEEAMHDETFHHPEVRTRIETLFGK